VDWLAAMEVKTELDHAEAKANDAGEWAVLLWQQLCERGALLCPEKGGGVTRCAQCGSKVGLGARWNALAR
jgi:hypothetical protein